MKQKTSGILRPAGISLFLVLSALMVTAHQQPDFSRILGDWTGESICVSGNNPSCHDEQVVYHLSVDPADASKIKMAADKIVNGKAEWMGDIYLKYDSGKQTLSGDLQSSRSRGTWEFTIKGNMMWGTLTMLPEKTVVRQMRVNRVEANQGKTEMTNHASGTFEVKLAPQDDKSDDKSLGRMTIDKQWHGDLDGTSKGQMLTGGDAAKGSAGYVAMEKFTGTLKGRKGSFILQHSATMIKGEGQLAITIVPDSGTDELVGIGGQLTIKIENGKHSYDLAYRLKE